MKTKLLFLAFLISVLSWGQVGITTSPQTHTQDFNSLSTTATAFTNNSTLLGWYISSSTLLVGAGGGNSNSCYK